MTSCVTLNLEWSSGRRLACCVEGPGFEPGVGSSIMYKISFHQQKHSNLSIAFNIKLEVALYSVFCAYESERPWSSLNE